MGSSTYLLNRAAVALLLAFCAFLNPMLSAFVEIFTHSRGRFFDAATNRTNPESGRDEYPMPEMPEIDVTTKGAAMAEPAWLISIRFVDIQITHSIANKPRRRDHPMVSCTKRSRQHITPFEPPDRWFSCDPNPNFSKSRQRG